MKKGNKNMIITLTAASSLVIAGSLLLQGTIRFDRTKKDTKNLIVDEQTVQAAFYADSPEGDSLKAASLKEAKKRGVTEQEEDSSTRTDDTGDMWIRPKAEIIVVDDSEEPRPEEMDEDTAAETGLRYLETWLNQDCENSVLHLALGEIIASDDESSLRVWRGNVQKSDSSCLDFTIDAVNGNPYILRTHALSPVQDMVDSSEYQNALWGLHEEQEKRMSEPWMSINDFQELADPATWSPIAKRFIREHGLNKGKTINSVSLVKFEYEYVILECYLNEMKEDKESITLYFDLRTRDPYMYLDLP